jgi:aconitase A
VARLDTPAELDYYRHGGILPYVFRQISGELAAVSREVPAL